MNQLGKKLLVLAGAGSHVKVVEAAKEMGIYTIVTDYISNFKASPAKKIADESLNYNIYDIEELIDFCSNNGVDGVLGFCIDPTQKPAQQIASRLGLPVFGDENQILALTDKSAFMELCLESGVDIIPKYYEEQIDTDCIVYPVLVKPTDSRGSRGGAVCYNKTELISAIPAAKTESSNNGVIIEKYMKGHQDLTISYIVRDGKPILISIGDRYSGREEDNLNRQLICTIQPSRYAKMYMEKVNDRVVKMIQKLGVKNGPVFMQGFVDGDTVRMYDPGIRFPGNEYERIFTKATGMNPIKSILSYVVGGGIDDYEGKLEGSYDLEGLCAIQYMINVGAGKIGVFEGLDEIAACPYVLDIQQRHFVGDVIEATGDIRHRAGEISILVERVPEKMKEAVAFVQSKLKVTDVEGKNMLISPFEQARIDNTYGNIAF